MAMIRRWIGLWGAGLGCVASSGCLGSMQSARVLEEGAWEVGAQAVGFGSPEYLCYGELCPQIEFVARLGLTGSKQIGVRAGFPGIHLEYGKQLVRQEAVAVMVAPSVGCVWGSLAIDLQVPATVGIRLGPRVELDLTGKVSAFLFDGPSLSGELSAGFDVRIWRHLRIHPEFGTFKTVSASGTIPLLFFGGLGIAWGARQPWTSPAQQGSVP